MFVVGGLFLTKSKNYQVWTTLPEDAETVNANKHSAAGLADTHVTQVKLWTPSAMLVSNKHHILAIVKLQVMI